MIIVSKISLFKTELTVSLFISHPPNWFLLLLLIYITIYSFTHSGSLRGILTSSTSSTRLQSPVDSNSSLSPVSFPLLLFGSFAAVLTQANMSAYIPLLVCLVPCFQSKPFPFCHLPGSRIDVSEMQMKSCYFYFKFLGVSYRTLLKFLHGANKAL